MNTKYILTNTTKTIWVGGNEITVRRIQALAGFSDDTILVLPGELGGFIESEKNLSINDMSWVTDNACVIQNACVCDRGWVGGNALVYGNARVITDGQVHDNARVGDDSRIHGRGRIGDNAKLLGHASIDGDACVFDNAEVNDWVSVRGDARVGDNAHLGGDIYLFGDVVIGGNVNMGNDLFVGGGVIKDVTDYVMMSFGAVESITVTRNGVSEFSITMKQDDRFVESLNASMVLSDTAFLAMLRDGQCTTTLTVEECVTLVNIARSRLLRK